MSSVDEILSRLEQLSKKMDFIQTDVSGLRRAVETDREEYRHEITALRGDLVNFVNRFNVATGDAKKKPIITPM